MQSMEKKFRGERVKQLLEDRHLTVQALATAAGVSQGALSNWLNGVRNPKRINIKAIANALKCKISDISDYSDDEIASVPQEFDFTQSINKTDFFASVYAELKYQVGNDGQARVADRLGVSQTHIGDLYNGNTSIENLKLSAFLNLFPKLKISLRGTATASDPIEAIQAIAECLTSEEAEKMLAVLKIIFPQYSNNLTPGS